MSNFGGDDDIIFDVRLDYDVGDSEAKARALGTNVRNILVRTLDTPQSRQALSKLFDTNNIVGDINALRNRIEALKQTLSKQGANPELFAVLNQEIRKSLELEREVEKERERLVNDSGYAESVKRRAQLIGQTSRAELATVERVLKNQRSIDQQAANDRLAAANANYRREEDIRRRAHSKMVSDTQQFTTLENATIRTEGAKQVQEAQARSRARIEATRFAFRQIIFLEQQLARAVRGAFSVAGSAFGSIQAGAARLGQVFRRSNRDVNDGLRGALNERERSLGRSFRNQTNTVRNETNQQRRAIEQLDRQLSTGALGILSGRGRFGGALGAGALIGGGLTGANLFSAGLDRFQSLERANLQLERMLGSATAARQALDELDNWARGTPLALDLVTEIAVGLISMGTAAEDVLPRLEAITDAVAFTGGGADEIRRVGLAIRQVASAGRLLGQDFNQIAQALPGLNLNQLLADQITGGDTAAFLKLRETGKVSAEQFVSAFVAGVQASDSIGGSTASLASTLQGQISNLNAAWRRLGAAIITQFEGPLRASIKRMRDNLSNLAKFVSGDVSTGFLALRSALVGVAIALAAIAAAKTAVQVIQLLGIAARFALTPMGFLVTAITAIAAAVGALRAVNDNFRYITDGIRDLASEALVRGVELLGAALSRFGRFLIETVVPGLLRLAQAALPFVITAIRVLVAIVNAVLIPAVRAGFGYLVDTAIPAAIDLAVALRQYLIPAVIALGAAWFVVNAPLSAVIATFAAVGAALLILRSNSEAVRGFTDDLAQSFIDLGSRLAGVGRTVGSAVVDAFGALGSALQELFSRIDYGALATRILGFVNELGRLLGRAITSRLAVQAAVAIGAAAAALAGAFLLGFAEGVITGLPGAVDALTDSLRVLLEQVGAPAIISGLFRNAFTGIGAVILAVVAASSVLRAFTSAGSRTAGAFSGGFGAGLRTGFTSAFRGLQALRDPERAIQNVAQRQARAYQQEFARIMRDNTRLGLQSSVAAGPIRPDQIDASLIRRLTGEQQRYIQTVGQATASAALFRQTWGQALFDTGNRWQALQDRVAQTGGWGAVGQRAGVALVTGFSAALAGQQGGTTGLVGVVAASLGALAVGGPVVAGITAAVGGVSLLIAELNKADGAAVRLAQTTERIRDALRGVADDEVAETLAKQLLDLTRESFGSDADALFSILPDSFFLNAARDIKEGTFVVDAAFSDLAANLGLNATQISDVFDLRDFIDTQSGGLVDFADVLESGARDVNEALLDLQFRFPAGLEITPELQRQAAAVTSLTTALTKLGIPAPVFLAFLDSLQVEAEGSAAGMASLRDEVRLTQEQLNQQLSDQNFGFSLDAMNEALGRGLDGTGFEPLDKLLEIEALQTAFNRVTGLIDEFGVEGVDVFAAVQAELRKTGVLIDSDLRERLARLVDGFLEKGRLLDLGALDFGFSLNAMNEALGRTGKTAGTAGDGLEDLAGEAERAAKRANLVTLAIQQLNQQRSDGIRNQIDGVRSRLDGATEAAERAKGAITSFFAPPKNASRLVDEAILNLDSVGSNIEDALNKGGLQGQAAIRVALGGFNDTIAGIIQQGFEDGLRTQEEFTALLAPLRAALGETVSESASRILSTVDFTAGITPAAGGKMADALNLVLADRKIEANVTAAWAAQSEVDRLQAELDSLNTALEVDVIFSPEQLAAALTQAGLDASLLMGFDLTGQQGLTPLEQQIRDYLTSLEPETAEGATGPTITGDITVVVPAPNPAQAGSSVVATLTGISYGRSLVPTSTAPSYRPGVPQ